MCENRLLMRGGELDKTGEAFVSSFPEELARVRGTVWDGGVRLVNMLRVCGCVSNLSAQAKAREEQSNQTNEKDNPLRCLMQ